MDITKWSLVDSVWLKAAIKAFLEANVARGGDLLASPRNVDAYLAIGLAGSARGEPCLVAVVDGEPCGFVLWTVVPPTLDSRWKTVNALGSYTAPGSRSRGVAAALRARALTMCEDLGIERIVGPVSLSNERGISEFIHTYDAWPTSVNFEFLTPWA